MALRIKVDEYLPVDVGELLRAAGHDALTVLEEELVGTPDQGLWRAVQQEKRCLFTADKGFANALTYPPGTHSGIVLFRLPRESRTGYVHLAESLLVRLSLDDIAGAIVVVTVDGVRIHRGQQ